MDLFGNGAPPDSLSRTTCPSAPPPPPLAAQLGVLLEWCRIRQMSIIGELRAGFCAHSALDQLADLAVRAAAVLRWEPELRQLQGERRGGGARERARAREK